MTSITNGTSPLSLHGGPTHCDTCTTQHEEFHIIILILALILEVNKGCPRFINFNLSSQRRSCVDVLDAVMTILALGCEAFAAAPLLINATTCGSGVIVVIQQPIDGQHASENGLSLLPPGEDRWPGVKEDSLGGIFRVAEAKYILTSLLLQPQSSMVLY